ncbi:MAG: hypothetical protein A2571_02115 [Candidatus Vogelbacteria bacterium RIFOXYD1_FULL_44_32]|uniref:Ribosome-binding factor A n=1 Tax=Candidatus Vogelbacteria bacterium RIFOXYD1_FULL_44_32 TaxID=1802438 RepID=A0A1G2QD82_9BACT|nr:MAG: hypothetical protein A2571_02115 [Candidatus Vogelbacteria bacterium RIFOXYD1_FULL_44_32]
MSGLLIRLVAEYIHREATTQSLITVRRVELEDFGKQATIFISVLPENMERPALAFVEHHLRELRDYVRDKSDLHTLPHFSVILDPEAKREIVEE